MNSKKRIIESFVPYKGQSNIIAAIALFTLVAIAIGISIAAFIYAFNAEEGNLTIGGSRVLNEPAPEQNDILMYNGYNWVPNSQSVVVDFINVIGLDPQIRITPSFNFIEEHLNPPRPGSYNILAYPMLKNLYYILPNVFTNSTIMLTDGNYTLYGIYTFANPITITASQGQIVLSPNGGNSITISTTSPESNITYTLQDVKKNTSFVMTDGNQTVNDVKEYTSTILLTAQSFQLTFQPNGSTTYITLSATPGATNVDVNIPYVGENSNVVLDQGDQSINGFKTFLETVYLNGSTNLLALQSGSVPIYITMQDPVAPVSYRLPDVGSNADFVMTEGPQNINGLKVFLETVTIQGATNLLALQSGSNIIYITMSNPVATISYNLPDVGSSADFVMTQGPQNINGLKAFLETVTLQGATNLLALQSGSNIIYITMQNPVATISYNLPDVGSSADFVMTQGPQNIYGVKSFYDLIVLYGSPNLLQLQSDSVPIYITMSNISATRHYNFPDAMTDSDIALVAASQDWTGINTYKEPIEIQTSNLKAFDLISSNNNKISIWYETPTVSERKYIIEDTGFDGYFVMTTGNETYNITQIGSSLWLTELTEQIVIQPGGSGPYYIINANSPQNTITYQLPDVLQSAYFVMTEGNQTVGGFKTIVQTLTLDSNLLFWLNSTSLTVSPGVQSSTSTVSVPNIGTTASNFVVTTASSLQSISTPLELTSTLTINTIDPQIILQANTPNSLSLSLGSFSGNRTYIFQDILKNGTVGLLEADQIWTGSDTFSEQAVFTAAINQIKLWPSGSGNSTTINADEQSENTVVSIPNTGSSTSSFVLTTTAELQTISTPLELISALTIDTASPQIVLQYGTSNSLSLGVQSLSGNWTYLFQDAGANDTIALLNAQQTFNDKVLANSEILTNTFWADATSTSKNLYIDLSTAAVLTRTTLLFQQQQSRTITFPDATDTVAMLGLSQIWTGTNTYNLDTVFAASSNQIKLWPGGSGTSVTITTSNPQSNLTLTIPDPLVSAANVVLNYGNTTINGFWTYTASQLTLSSGGVNINVGTTPAITISSSFIWHFVTTVFETTSNQIYIKPCSTCFDWIISITSSPAQNVVLGLIDPLSPSANIVLSKGNQTLSGYYIFTNQVVYTSSSNQIELQPGGTGTTTTINTQTQSVSTVVNIPNVGGSSASFVLTTSSSSQSISSPITLTHTLTINTPDPQIILETSGYALSIGISPLTGNWTYVFQDAKGNGTIAILEANQTFTGINTFAQQIILTAETNAIQFPSAFNSAWIGSIYMVNIGQTSQYLIPDPGVASTNFILSDLACGEVCRSQTINSLMTFTNGVYFYLGSNQIEFNAGDVSNAYIFNVGPPAQPVTVNFPDPGRGSVTVAFLEATQKWNGTNTFTNSLYLTASSNQIVMQPGGSGNTVTFSTSSPSASFTIDIPNVGGICSTTNMVLSCGATTLGEGGNVHIYQTGTFVIDGDWTNLGIKSVFAMVPDHNYLVGGAHYFVFEAETPTQAIIINVVDPGNANVNMVFDWGEYNINSLWTFAAGLTFGSSFGGSTLEYHQTKLNTQFTLTFTATQNPIAATTLTVYARYQRTGNLVLIMVDAYSATATISSEFCTASGAIPSNIILPHEANSVSTNQIWAEEINVFSAGSQQAGLFQTDSTGIVCIYANSASANFAATGTAGWRGFTVSWITDV